jgi:universal stress protein E
MQQFRKLLVMVSGDPTRQPALMWAARLAQRNGAGIKLLAVTEDLPWYTRLVLPDAEERQRALVRDRSEALEELAAPLRLTGLDVATEVRTGRGHLEVVREVVSGGHDTLLKEAEPNQRVLFGSTDMHLLRNCPCPLWLLKPGHEGGGFARVLAAVDPAPATDEADLLHLKAELAPNDAALDAKVLELASSLADEVGGELHVVHAWSAPGEALVRGDLILTQEQVDQYVEESRAEARKAVDQLLARFPDPTGRRRFHLLKGDPADVIADFAMTGHVDLIVMGTVGRSGIPGVVIGNTAESILQRVECSVLAIKPEGFVCPIGLDD